MIEKLILSQLGKNENFLELSRIKQGKIIHEVEKFNGDYPRIISIRIFEGLNIVVVNNNNNIVITMITTDIFEVGAEKATFKEIKIVDILVCTS